jgi:hypothetical protein
MTVSLAFASQWQGAVSSTLVNGSTGQVLNDDHINV